MPPPPLSSLLHQSNRQVASLSGQWPAVPAAAHRGPHPQGRPQEEQRLQDKLLTAAAAETGCREPTRPALYGCTARLYCTTAQDWCTVQCSVVYNGALQTLMFSWISSVVLWYRLYCKVKEVSLIVHCQQCSTVHYAVQCCIEQCSAAVQCCTAQSPPVHCSPATGPNIAQYFAAELVMNYFIQTNFL